jgi:hypothetical protein
MAAKIGWNVDCSPGRWGFGQERPTLSLPYPYTKNRMHPMAERNPA